MHKLKASRIGLLSFWCAVLFVAIFLPDLSQALAEEIAAADPLPIAERIFKNECDVEKNCLIQWNNGENFLSLGLGHFIWYPENIPAVFGESFRGYLQYAREAGEQFPVWLDQTPFPSCPWSTREQFLSSKESLFYKELADFLARTRHRQAEYLMDNAQIALRSVIDAAPPDQRPRISRDIAWLSGDQQGLYAITDYVNFKGSGVRQSESYDGQGWGVLQVLEAMHDTSGPQETLTEFARAAKEVLQRRVANAPWERNEAQWLPGWLRRIDTYIEKR